MLNKILLYAGSILPFLWGAAHLFPTNSVVKGFGNLSEDNRRIITMEWIIEGVALIFIGVLVFSVTLINHKSYTSIAVYWITFAALNTLSVVSLFTGFKVNFLPFRLCPFIFTGSSILLLLGITI